MNSDIEISHQIKPILFNNSEIIDQFINIKDKYNLQDDMKLITLIVFSKIINAIFLETNFENINIEDINVGDILRLTCKKGGKKTNKTRKKLKGGNKKFLFLLFLFSIMSPIVRSGISSTQTDKLTWLNTTRSVLSIGDDSLTPQQGVNWGFNDLGVVNGRTGGYCSGISLMQSGMVSIEEFGKAISHMAKWVKDGNTATSYHIGNAAALSYALDINLDVTEFTVKKNNLKKGLDAIQKNMFQERQKVISEGLFNDQHWASSALSIPGHFLSVTITSTGAMFIKNADLLVTSAAKTPGEYYGFYITYRPPLGGETPESKAEYDLINDSLGGGVQNNKEKYRDTFFDYIKRATLQTKKGRDFVNFKLIGVIGGDYGKHESWLASFFSDRSTGLNTARYKKKYLNNLGNKQISVNPKKKFTRNGVLTERYTIENPNAKNRSSWDLQGEMNDVHRQSETARLVKQQQKLAKRAQLRGNAARLKRANKAASGRSGYPVSRYSQKRRGGTKRIKRKKTRRRT